MLAVSRHHKYHDFIATKTLGMKMHKNSIEGG